jgi:hypothetical protein
MPSAAGNCECPPPVQNQPTEHRNKVRTLTKPDLKKYIYKINTTAGP